MSLDLCPRPPIRDGLFTFDVVSGPGHGAEVGVDSRHSSQLEKRDQVNEVTGQQRHHSAPHVGVTQPAVIRVQQTGAVDLDVHQVDVVTNEPLHHHHLLHHLDAGVESETVPQDCSERGIVLTSLDHAQTLGLVETTRDTTEHMLA